MPKKKTKKSWYIPWYFFWNFGFAVWPAQKMLAQFEKHFKAGYEALIKIQEAWGTDKQEKVLKREYEKIPKTSVDFAINAHLSTNEQVVISADLAWRDIGTWNELKEEMSQKPEDNIIQGNIVELDVKDSLIYSSKKDKLIAAIGLEGLVVVDTEDALLVCPKDRSPDVKKIIERLKEDKKDKYL